MDYTEYQKKRPNIVLINCDDMGYGDLGCYGSELNDTPFIDQLAKEGVLFTSCYATSPVCSPSRASLLTGCYPPRVSMNRVLFPGEEYGLNPREYTVANMFKENGYETAIIGKWHCGDQLEFMPTKYGFDYYYGLPYSNDMGIQANRVDRRKNPPVPYPPMPLIENEEVIEEQPDQRSLTERYVEKCNAFIRKNKDNPFFLYFPQMHVHLPLYANADFERNSKNGDFGACMAEVDWACKAIVYELKKQNIYEDTCIIFTSDNGSRAAEGASNGILRGKKFYTWEGGMRVPAVFHWKNMLQEGKVVDKLCGQVDFLPLFAHMIGAKLPENLLIDGVDIYDTVFHNETTRNRFLYYGPNKLGEETGYLCAIREGNWKMHYQIIDFSQKGAPYVSIRELYDLEEDIRESNNVYAEYPEVVERFDLLYQEYSEKLGNQGMGKVGTLTRTCGKVDEPKTLTAYDENHPYIVAMYDKNECG